MTNKIWRPIVRAAVLVASLCAGTMSQAAVFYQSKFDPLGFAGTAVWKVEDNCGIAALPNGYYGVNLFDVGGCDVALFSLTVSLWEGSAPDIVSAATDHTLVTEIFPDESLSSDPELVAGIYVKNGALAGVDTFLIGPQRITNTAQCLPSNALDCGEIDQEFGVQFTSGHAPSPGFLSLVSALPSGLFGGIPAAAGNLSVPGAYLWEQGNYRLLNWSGICPALAWTFVCEAEVPLQDGGYARFTNLNADGTFPVLTDADPTVPEPASLALVFGALGAGWLARRRKIVA